MVETIVIKYYEQRIESTTESRTLANYYKVTAKSKRAIPRALSTAQRKLATANVNNPHYRYIGYRVIDKQTKEKYIRSLQEALVWATEPVIIRKIVKDRVLANITAVFGRSHNRDTKDFDYAIRTTLLYSNKKFANQSLTSIYRLAQREAEKQLISQIGADWVLVYGFTVINLPQQRVTAFYKERFMTRRSFKRIPLYTDSLLLYNQISDRLEKDWNNDVFSRVVVPFAIQQKILRRINNLILVGLP